MPSAEETQKALPRTTRRKARRVAQKATRRAAEEAERAASTGAEGSRGVSRPSRRPPPWAPRPTTRRVVQPKGAAQPVHPVASSSSEEQEGSFAPDRPFVLFHRRVSATAGEKCEWCLQEFTPRLPFAPVSGLGQAPVSQGRADLRLCSGCVPLVHLTELLQTASDEQREFIRLSVGSLDTFLKTSVNYPLPLELGGFRWTQPARPKRTNPYSSGRVQPKCRPRSKA